MDGGGEGSGGGGVPQGTIKAVASVPDLRSQRATRVSWISWGTQPWHPLAMRVCTNGPVKGWTPDPFWESPLPSATAMIGTFTYFKGQTED